MLKIKLSNEYQGSILCETDPDGLSELEVQLLRSAKNDGVFYELTLNLTFFKEGREFIQSVYENHGIEEEVQVEVFDYSVNSYQWDSYYVGTLKMDNYDIGETDVKINVEQKGFQRKFISLAANEIDIETQKSFDDFDLPATPTLNQLYHSKKILKIGQMAPANSNEFIQGAALTINLSDCGLIGKCNENDGKIIYGQISTEDGKIKDVLDLFELPWGYGSPSLATGLAPWSSFSASSGVYDIGSVVLYDSGSARDYYISTINNNPNNPTHSSWKKGLAEVLKIKKNPRNPFYVVANGEAGVVDFDIRLDLKHAISATYSGGGADVDIDWPCTSGGVLGYREARCFFEHRDISDNIITLQEFGAWDSFKGCGGNSKVSNYEVKNFIMNNVTVNEGDKVYVYFTISVYADYHKGNSSATITHTCQVAAHKDNTWVKVVNRSTGEPESKAKSVLVYESLKKVAQWATSQEDCFKSDYFGRTDLGYAADGAGSMTMVTNGRNLRNSPDEKIYISWDDIFNSLNTQHCLGWGFEVIDGVMKIVVEGKEHFFNKNVTVLEIAEPVRNLRKEVAEEYYYNVIDFAYPKLDVKQQNGVDEFNTIRKYTVPYTKGKKKLDIKSPYRAAGYEIESQRRLIGDTKDSKIDSDNFLVSVKRNGASPTGYDTAKNESFPTLLNVFDPDSIYNVEFSPGRSLTRWSKWLASMVLKLKSKVISFSSGDFNYIMESKKSSEAANVAENENFDLSGVEAIFVPEKYKFDSKLSSTEFKLLRDNPYGVVKFRDSFDNKYEGFMLKVKHKSVKKTAQWELLKVFRLN